MTKGPITEPRRADDARRERESSVVVDTIPGLVAILTPNGEVDVVNHELVDYCGQPLEAMKRWGTNGTVHVDDVPRIGPVFAEAIATGSPYDFEARIRRFDGIYRWCQVRGLPWRDASGHIGRWYVVLIDIDERKHAEDALRESERELRLIVDSIPGFVATCNPAGEIEFVNRQMLEYFGKTLEEHRGWATNGMVHPDDLPRIIERFTHSIASGDPFDFEVRARRSDGVYRWFQVRGFPLRDRNAHIVRWYILLIDIDARKRMEAEIRRAHDSLAEAQRLSKTGSFMTDLVADVHDWSEEALRIFGFDPAKKVTLQAIREVIHPEDMPGFEDAFTRAMEGLDVNLAYRIITSNGHLKHVVAVAHVITNVDGSPVFVGALQDVTERELAAEALSRARSDLAHVSRVTTLGALTASIAHEVNQPLSGIITNAGTCLRMLAADPPDVDGARETARRTLRDGNRASDVITRLRALFSRKEFTLEPLDMNDITREVVALSMSDLQRNRVVLQSEFADSLPMVIGDRIQLQQVILNLLRNASDAMGTVNDRPRQLLISTAREVDDVARHETALGDRVRVTVRDAGPGLDLESMNKLFDAFYTTKLDGMGIGLSVSRSIIEKHHGRLWAEPNDGPGATFSFSIPAAVPEIFAGAAHMTPH